MDRNKLTKLIKIIDKYVQNFAKGMCIFTLGVIVLLVGIQVVSRYIFSYSFFWIEELVRYLCVYFAFVGGSLALRRNELVGVSLFIDAVPKVVQRPLRILGKFLIVVFLVVVIVYSFDLIYLVTSRNQLSPALRIPMGLAYGAIPMGVILMFFFVISSWFLEKEV
ncbi:TRAP transporter small permease [Desulfoscipio geothermicus]|uniref:TRAP-type C4-dicarboxylate transport system, small permease component n=1 Tax=Desulfoscipio geothermicus DSM 3669 TaxID=1121426 RepID=A0A1I6D5X3_9FIRM|nr:TRAP transporter small permease [Desulfoscipio geothermicus]SFR00865.1 TRAP-type C4-dicarboxylate transport system, small permease component [Desulfoscipio geothermicus DSM 3669]